MKRELVLMAAVLGCSLALAGCGGTCETAAAPLSTVATSCTLQAGAVVQLEVKPACQQCGQSSPTCGSEFVNNQIELTPLFRTCQGDTSCPVQNCGSSFICNVTTPAQSGTVTIAFPTASGSATKDVTLVDAGGQTSCSL